jgi:GAF domain-containing protein
LKDTLADPAHANNLMTQMGGRFYAGAPLVTPEGHAIGTLCVSDTEPRRPTDGQLQGLRTLATAIATHLELRRQLTQTQVLAFELEGLASRDALTGAANRRRFDQALSQAIATAATTKVSLGLNLIDVLQGIQRRSRPRCRRRATELVR